MTPRKMLKEHLWKVSSLSWILKLINIPVSVLTAKLTASVVTEATGGNVNQVLLTGTLLLILVIGAKIFNIVTEISYKKMLSKAEHRARISLYQRFLENPLHVLYRSENGEALVKLTKDFVTAKEKYVALMPEFWISVITTIAYFVILALQNVTLAVIFLVISVIQVVPPAISKKYLEVNYENNQEVEEQEANFIISGYRGFSTIKLYGLKSWWLGRLKDIHKLISKYGNQAETACAVEDAMGKFFGQVLKYGSYIIAGLFMLYGYITLEIGVEAIALAPSLFTAVNTIFQKIPDFGVAAIAEKRLAKWFGAQAIREELLEGTQIQLEDVSFSYEEKEVLNQASVIFNCEKINLLKGANGIGKSTLFRLITGLCECREGHITIGNKASFTLSDENFPEKLFYLPQEDPEFGVTAEELYQMMLPGQEAEVLKTAEGFALTKEQLRSTKINELSGGERKKVFLALAFTLNPQILLLDEPTNSLDDAGKKGLKELLKKRSSGAVIITHEELFDDMADHTYYIGNGGITLEENQQA